MALRVREARRGKRYAAPPKVCAMQPTDPSPAACIPFDGPRNCKRVEALPADSDKRVLMTRRNPSKRASSTKFPWPAPDPAADLASPSTPVAQRRTNYPDS